MGRLNTSLQEMFFAWLSKKVSATQLSDYYIVFSEIDAFCRSRSVLKTNFFDVTDEKTVNQVKNSLESNKAFRFLHRSSYLKLQSALTFYKSFLQEKQGSFGALMNLYQVGDSAKEELATKKPAEAVDFPRIKAVAEKSDVALINNNEDNRINSRNVDRDISVSAVLQDAPIVLHQVSFEVEKSYAFTRPIKIEYFGDEYSVSNWSQAYAKTVTLLYDDYPDELERLIGKNISNGKHADFESKVQASLLTAPEQIASDLFIETDLSATDIIDKIKRLLEICLTDYDNLIITYTVIDGNDMASQSKAQGEAGQVPVIEDVKTARGAFIGWMMEAGLKPGTVFSYLSALNQSSKFGLEHQLIDVDFLKMNTPELIHTAYTALMQNTVFAQMNQDQHNRFRAAIMKYHEYRSSINPSTSSVGTLEALRADIPILSAELKDRFALVLREFFENGYRPGNAIDINRFRLYYSEKYGSNLAESDDRITKLLGIIGACRNGRIYAKADTEQRDILAEIKIDVDAAFSQGASCVYLEALFDRYQDQLTESMQVYNADALKDAFLASFGGSYYNRYSYLATYKKVPDTDSDVLSYLKASHLPVSYDTLKHDLWYIPFDKIKHILVTTRSMVNVGHEAYFYAPNLPVSADELKTIIELIKSELLQNSFISGTDLIALLEQRCPSVIINTEGFPAWGLRNALGYLLRDHFAFNGNIISSLRKEVSMSQVFAGYCAKKNRVTLIELKDLAVEANTRIYWESVYAVMVRVSQDLFINKKDVQFDVRAIDESLEMLIPGEYAPTKSINLFFQLPPTQYPWNGYMLESYIYSYSKVYNLVHPCFQQTDYCGGIVRKGSQITEYYDLVVRVLFDTNGWKDKREALGILTSEGYQQRNAYKEIDAAVSEAKRLKETVKH